MLYGGYPYGLCHLIHRVMVTKTKSINHGMGKDNIIIFGMGKNHLQQRRERESGRHHFLDGKRGRNHRSRFGFDCLSGLIENRQTDEKRTITYPCNPNFTGNPYGMCPFGYPCHQPVGTQTGLDIRRGRRNRHGT